MDESQEATVAESTGVPNCGPAATMASSTALNIDILHAVVGVDAPALDRVVVIELNVGEWRLPRRARGLYVAALIGGATLQHRRFAIPLPGQTEPGEALRQHGCHQLGARPAAAGIHRDL